MRISIGLVLNKKVILKIAAENQSNCLLKLNPSVQFESEQKLKI